MIFQVPINADIIFSIVDKDGVKTRAKRCEYTFEKNLPSDNRGFAKWVSVVFCFTPHCPRPSHTCVFQVCVALGVAAPPVEPFAQRHPDHPLRDLHHRRQCGDQRHQQAGQCEGRKVLGACQRNSSVSGLRVGIININNKTVLP